MNCHNFHSGLTSALRYEREGSQVDTVVVFVCVVHLRGSPGAPLLLLSSVVGSTRPLPQEVKVSKVLRGGPVATSGLWNLEWNFAYLPLNRSYL